MEEAISGGVRLYAGKTKSVIPVWGHPDLVILDNSNFITRDDDPSKTRWLPWKGKSSNVQSCRMMERLHMAEINVAYIRQINETASLNFGGQAVRIEGVWRRGIDPDGSYAKRNPEVFEGKERKTIILDNPIIELFLKTDNQQVCDLEGKVIVSGLGVDDPLILDPSASGLILVHPKKPDAIEVGRVRADMVVPKGTLETITRDLPLGAQVVQSAYDPIKWVAPDGKAEWIVTADGRILWADVKDLDSYRVRDRKGRPRCKQLFRNDRSDSLHAYVMANYQAVAQYLQWLKEDRIIDIEELLEEWEAIYREEMNAGTIINMDPFLTAAA